jgi:hypothetical protein
MSYFKKVVPVGKHIFWSINSFGDFLQYEDMMLLFPRLLIVRWLSNTGPDIQTVAKKELRSLRNHFCVGLMDLKVKIVSIPRIATLQSGSIFSTSQLGLAA